MYVTLCAATLRETGSCDHNHAMTRTLVGYATGIEHDPACSARDGNDRYDTRFGDVACDECHAPLAWSPALVRDGIYGDGTRDWITRRETALARR